jgi:hypothetical protein
MPIIRSKANIDFFVMHNATAQDSNLSWAARGMLCYLLSKPEGWKTSMADLTRQTKAGRDACKSAFKELEAAGYAIRVKRQGAAGLIVWDTIIKDRPSMDEPSMDEPSTDKASIYKEQTLENTDIENIEKKDSSSVSKKNGPGYTDGFERFWKAWKPYQTPSGNKREAFNEWVRHVPADWSPDALIEKAEQYTAQCQRTDTNTKHVCRWIKYHGWEQDYGPPKSGYDMVMDTLDEKWRREDAGKQEADQGIGDRPATRSLPEPMEPGD